MNSLSEAWGHYLVVTTLAGTSMKTGGQWKGFVLQMSWGKEVGREHPKLILWIYFSFHLIWSVAIINETFLAYHVDLQVLPLGLAEAVNQEDPLSFATFFSSLVRINEGSKASFSAGFGVKESVFSPFWQRKIPWCSEKSLLPEVMSLEVAPEQVLLFALAWYYML